MTPPDDTDDGARRPPSLERLADSIRTRQSDADGRTERGHTPDDPPAEHSVPEAVTGAADVLVLCAGYGERCDRQCVNLLSPPGGTNVLTVTTTRSADRWLGMWQRFSSRTPERMVIVSLGEDPATTATSTTVSTPDGPKTLEIEALHDLDLTRLGITISRSLSEVGASATRTSVCVHSLTTLLQYVEPERLFRFLQILRGRVRSAGALAHYHLNPDAHDERTVRTFESLFDVVVEVTETGDLDVVSAPE
jgi:hypothetical protein